MTDDDERIKALAELDTLAKQLASVLKNDPRYVEKLGPGMARDLFMLGAQSALHVIAVSNGLEAAPELRFIMRAIGQMHDEIGKWLKMPPSRTEH